jgi:ABC-type multidrug transport system fused ATPase/permease subunit
MQTFYFMVLVIQYNLLNLVSLFNNEKLHEDMIHGLVRCPSSYFDTTPSGRLINKFSNDLGILDNTLAFVIIDTVQGPIISIIMLINIFQID